MNHVRSYMRLREVRPPSPRPQHHFSTLDMLLTILTFVGLVLIAAIVRAL